MTDLGQFGTRNPAILGSKRAVFATKMRLCLPGYGNCGTAVAVRLLCRARNLCAIVVSSVTEGGRPWFQKVGGLALTLKIDATTILHVGEDVCQRIPVMETAGFAVLKTKIALPAIHAAFDHGDSFSAVIFHSDIHAPSRAAVYEARNLSTAPFVLFQNPSVSCANEDFDFIIPVLTPPAVWLKGLSQVIADSLKLRERSLQLREDCNAARSWSSSLRTQLARNVKCPVNPDALWRGVSGDSPEFGEPDPSRGHDRKR